MDISQGGRAHRTDHGPVDDQISLQLILTIYSSERSKNQKNLL